jgi:hypothetical protein
MKIKYAIRDFFSRHVLGMPYGDFQTLQISSAIASRLLTEPFNKVDKFGQTYHATYHARKVKSVLQQNFPNLAAVYYDNQNH